MVYRMFKPIKDYMYSRTIWRKTEDWAGLRTVDVQQQTEDGALMYNFNTVLVSFSRTHHSIKAMDRAQQGTKDRSTLLLPPGAWGLDESGKCVENTHYT